MVHTSINEQSGGSANPDSGRCVGFNTFQVGASAMEYIIEIRTDPTSFMKWFHLQTNTLTLIRFPTADVRYSAYRIQVMDPTYHADPRLGIERPIRQGQPLGLTFFGFYEYPTKSRPDQSGAIQEDRSSPRISERRHPLYENVGAVMTVEISRVAIAGTSDSTRVCIKSRASDLDHVSVLLRGIALIWEHTRDQYTAGLLRDLHSRVSQSEWAEWEAMDWATEALARDESAALPPSAMTREPVNLGSSRAGRPPDPLYDQAFEKLRAGEAAEDIFAWYCQHAGIVSPSKSDRDGFKAAMKRRSK